MKLLIIGFKDGVNDELIENGVIALQDIMGIDVKATIYTEDEFLPTNKNKKSIRKSDFMIAIEKIIEVCGEESDSIAFCSSFYTLVLKGVIERPILEVLSYGPKTNRDLEFLSKRKEMENIVEYARVALSMIS